MPEPQRILVVLPNWVGDAVMFTPALRALRGRFPQASIVLLGRPGPAAVLDPNPWNAHLVVDTGRHWSLARRLRRERFDLAVLGPNSFRSAWLAFLSRAKSRVGYNRDGRGLLLTQRLQAPRTPDGRWAVTPALDYYLALVASMGCAVTNKRMELLAALADQDRVEALLAAVGHDGRRLMVVLNPGASFGLSKMYPPDRFAAAADELVRRRGAQIVINAGPGEAAIAESVQSAMREPVLLNLARQKNSLGLVKALIARCDLLITNDTGPRHFAAAFGRPVVTIFGATDPDWTTIYYAGERIVRVNVPCGPCQQKVCRLDGPQHHQCMLQISPQMVLQAALSLLPEGGA